MSTKKTKARRGDVAGRFWERIEKNAASGCWWWTGTMGANGYGHFSVKGWPCLAHRFSYEFLVGPIPEGLEIDHLCKNTACVNPEHLEAVTRRENALRSDSPAARNAKKTHCPQGHPYEGDNILTRPGKAGRECRTCNRQAALRRYHARKHRD